jgi:predicted nucleic acid-binding protein
MFLLDTNILVYAWDARDPRKQSIARELVRSAMKGEGIVAQHILSEFAAVMLHKMRPAASPSHVLAALDSLSEIRLAPAGPGVVRRAVEASQAYGIHHFDGLVVASAHRAGCTRIYSEDLNHGQIYFGVELVNPFLN